MAMTVPAVFAGRTAAPFANLTEGLERLEFTWDSAQIPFVTEEGKPLLIRWVHQLNEPVYTCQKGAPHTSPPAPCRR
jgi:hypothetical protein